MSVDVQSVVWFLSQGIEHGDADALFDFFETSHPDNRETAAITFLVVRHKCFSFVAVEGDGERDATHLTLITTIIHHLLNLFTKQTPNIWRGEVPLHLRQRNIRDYCTAQSHLYL